MAASEGLACASCGKPAKMQCPKCIALDLPKELGCFCAQDCFKAAWGEHKKLHTCTADAWMYCLNHGEDRTNKMPGFPWTGELRPYRIGPRRHVPDHIARPDYANRVDGYPEGEQQSKQQRLVPERTPKEIEKLAKACRLGREILDKAHAAVAPGVTTDEIDRIVHEATVEAGAYPSPLNYFNFPKSVCTSVNEVICHGIPDRRELQDGDIINVDVTAYIDGFHGDLNETFVVGEVDEESKKLIKTTHECLMLAIDACKPGVRYRDIGDIITKHAKASNFSVVKTYCGHGIGDLFHCAPNIPHYSKNKAVGTMKVGQTFTIEPMINVGGWRDTTWPDKWTAVTEDGKRSAQFEHTIAITEDGADILTARLPTSPPLWWEK